MGGQQTLQNGLKALDNPKIQSVLGKYGVDVNAVKSFGNNFLNNGFNQQQIQSSNTNNSLMDRLKKL